MVTVITVNITNFNNHYHIVILKIVSITMFCSDVHYVSDGVRIVLITEAIVRLQNKWLSTLGSLKMM